MNIKVNYDLVNKMYESKHGYKLSREVKTLLLGGVLSAGMLSPALAFVSPEDIKTFVPKYLAFILVSSFLGGKMCKKITNSTAMNNANLSLDLLSSELNNNNVDITPDLLKEGVVTSKKYKLEYKDKDSITKRLKKYEYIDVPLSNGYNKTLVQEHFVGIKDYNIKEEKIKKMCK